MNYLLDVNLLIALIWESHEDHWKTRQWLATVQEFSTCPLTQLGFGRISSDPQLGFSVTPDQAFTYLRRFLGDARHSFIPDDLSAQDRVVRTDLMGGPKQVTDLYLAALAKNRGITLATLDENLAAKFRDEPKLIHLVT